MVHCGLSCLCVPERLYSMEWLVIIVLFHAFYACGANSYEENVLTKEFEAGRYILGIRFCEDEQVIRIRYIDVFITYWSWKQQANIECRQELMDVNPDQYHTIESYCNGRHGCIRFFLQYTNLPECRNAWSRSMLIEYVCVNAKSAKACTGATFHGQMCPTGSDIRVLNVFYQHMWSHTCTGDVIPFCTRPVEKSHLNYIQAACNNRTGCGSLIAKTSSYQCRGNLYTYYIRAVEIIYDCIEEYDSPMATTPTTVRRTTLAEVPSVLTPIPTRLTTPSEEQHDTNENPDHIPNKQIGVYAAVAVVVVVVIVAAAVCITWAIRKKSNSSRNQDQAVHNEPSSSSRLINPPRVNNMYSLGDGDYSELGPTVGGDYIEVGPTASGDVILDTNSTVAAYYNVGDTARGPDNSEHSLETDMAEYATVQKERKNSDDLELHDNPTYEAAPRLASGN